MSVLVCNNLDIEVAGAKLLQDISFRLEKGDKAGLIGPNGSGKTTLLRTVLGEHPYERGEISCVDSVGYLPQQVQAGERDGTVFDAMLEQRTDILKLREKLRYLELAMSGEAEEKTIERYGTLTERYEGLGGYILEANIRRILSGLGLEQEQTKPVRLLSGGQKTRLALGKLLLQEPELLILDEPTNHLDLEALEWLENYLAGYKGTLLVVSHDRYFLDRIAGRILLIKNGGIRSYRGNYSEYELQGALEEKTLAREAEKINKKIAGLEEYIRRHRAGIKARQARGREKQLQRLNRIEIAEVKKALKLKLGKQVRSGSKVLEVNDLSIRYGEKQVFGGVSLEVRRGDKIALLGKNGVGKTSLLKAVAGAVPYEGVIKTGANVTIGFFSQEHEDFGRENTVLEEIRYSSTMNDPQARSVLARFGFSGEDVFKPLAVLSGGEKSRLALCKLFLSEGNLLLLDEPTNHLDMETRMILEEALSEYEGTALIVSHDRYFLDKIVNSVAVLTSQGLRIFPGDYTDYREYMEEEGEKEKAEALNEQPANAYREESRNSRRKARRLQQLEEKIEKTEVLLKDIERDLHSSLGGYEETLALHQEYERVSRELDELMAEWLSINE